SQGVVDAVAPYVATLRPEVRDSAEQPAALALALVAAGDVVGLVDGAALAYRGRVSRRLRRSGQQWRWPDLPGPAGDVTALVAHLTRWGLHLDHFVTHMSVQGDRVHVEVSTTDPLELLTDLRSVRLLVVARARG